jgi:hypothetical protein
MVALPYNNVITLISSSGSGYYVPPSTLPIADVTLRKPFISEGVKGCFGFLWSSFAKTVISRLLT